MTPYELLDKDKFFTWLKAKETEDRFYICGVSNEEDQCPIHTYLAETEAGFFFIGSDSFYERSNPDQSMELPAWAVEFVHNIDNNCEGEVLVGEALDQMENL